MTIDWPAIGKAALYIGLPLAGFLLGGGLPWRAYRRMGDLALVARLEPHFVPRSEYEGHVREEKMARERHDELLAMALDQHRAVLQLTGAVERGAEAVKYIGADLQEVKRDMEDLSRKVDALEGRAT